MKVMALDLGDAWVGTALTDALRFFSKPYKTVAADQLETFLQEKRIPKWWDFRKSFSWRFYTAHRQDSELIKQNLANELNQENTNVLQRLLRSW